MGKRATLLVPALAGGAWVPESGKQVRTVANWALKWCRYRHTDLEGNVVGLIEPLPEALEFPSWVARADDRRFGSFTGAPVIFEWRRFLTEVPLAGFPALAGGPARCVARPLGTRAAQAWVLGEDWGLVFEWDAPEDGSATAPALVVHPPSDGSAVKAYTLASVEERVASASAASHRFADKLAARFPGSGLTGWKGRRGGPRTKPFVVPVDGGGLFGGSPLPLEGPAADFALAGAPGLLPAESGAVAAAAVGAPPGVAAGPVAASAAVSAAPAVEAEPVAAPAAGPALAGGAASSAELQAVAAAAATAAAAGAVAPKAGGAVQPVRLRPPRAWQSGGQGWGSGQGWWRGRQGWGGGGWQDGGDGGWGSGAGCRGVSGEGAGGNGGAGSSSGL